MKHLFLAILALGVIFSGCNSDDTAETTETTDNSAVVSNEAENDDMMSTDVIQNPNTAAETAPAGAENYPVMTFEKSNHDFGNIKQGEKVQYNFKFTNTGKSDLIITNAQASCGCTVPSYPKEPIKPGETGVIPVEFDSKGKLNKVSKDITITANTNPNINRLTIETFIEPAN